MIEVELLYQRHMWFLRARLHLFEAWRLLQIASDPELHVPDARDASDFKDAMEKIKLADCTLIHAAARSSIQLDAERARVDAELRIIKEKADTIHGRSDSPSPLER